MEHRLWFDDAFKSTITIAFPLLKKCGLKGIVAVITGRVGQTSLLQLPERKLRMRFPLMNVEDLKVLVHNGWQMASHSVNHEGFDKLTLKGSERELTESKQWIINNLGVTPEWFVAPQHHIRPEQKVLALKHYKFVRAIPPLETDIIWHWILDDLGFMWKLRNRVITDKGCIQKYSDLRCIHKTWLDLYLDARKTGKLTKNGKRPEKDAKLKT